MDQSPSAPAIHMTRASRVLASHGSTSHANHTNTYRFSVVEVYYYFKLILILDKINFLLITIFLNRKRTQAVRPASFLFSSPSITFNCLSLLSFPSFPSFLSFLSFPSFPSFPLVSLVPLVPSFYSFSSLILSCPLPSSPYLASYQQWYELALLLYLHAEGRAVDESYMTFKVIMEPVV